MTKILRKKALRKKAWICVCKRTPFHGGEHKKVRHTINVDVESIMTKEMGTTNTLKLSCHVDFFHINYFNGATIIVIFYKFYFLIDLIICGA